MQEEGVAVGILEERHLADGGLERLAVELDAFRLELGAHLVDVVDGANSCPMLVGSKTSKVTWPQLNSRSLSPSDSSSRPSVSP